MLLMLILRKPIKKLLETGIQIVIPQVMKKKKLKLLRSLKRLMKQNQSWQTLKKESNMTWDTALTIYKMEQEECQVDSQEEACNSISVEHLVEEEEWERLGWMIYSRCSWVNRWEVPRLTLSKLSWVLVDVEEQIHSGIWEVVIAHAVVEVEVDHKGLHSICEQGSFCKLSLHLILLSLILIM